MLQELLYLGLDYAVTWLIVISAGYWGYAWVISLTIKASTAFWVLAAVVYVCLIWLFAGTAEVAASTTNLLLYQSGVAS